VPFLEDIDMPSDCAPRGASPSENANDCAQPKTAAEKVGELTLLGLTGVQEYLSSPDNQKKTAVLAAEAAAIAAGTMVVVASAPIWLTVGAVGAGVALVGKELYDKGKQVFPAVEIVWDGTSDQKTTKKAQETIKSVVGETIVDTAVTTAAGGCGGKIGSVLGKNPTIARFINEAGEKIGSVFKVQAAEAKTVPQAKATDSTQPASGATAPRLSDDEISAMSNQSGEKLRQLDKVDNEKLQKREDERKSRGEYGRPGGGMRNNVSRQGHGNGLDNALDNISPEVGRKFDGHGMRKGGVEGQLRALDGLLTEGADPTRVLYTARVRGAEEAAGAVGAERPFTDGGFILLGPPGGTIHEHGIKSVIVNDHLTDAIPRLQKLYPNVEFIRAEDAPHRLAELAQRGTPQSQLDAMAAQKAKQDEAYLAARPGLVEQRQAEWKERADAWERLNKTHPQDSNRNPVVAADREPTEPPHLPGAVGPNDAW
jgi:hypothetical protein